MERLVNNFILFKLKQELKKKKEDFNDNLLFGRQQNDNTQNKIVENLVD